MAAVKIKCWKDDGVWLGYLLDHPDYWTQGTTFDDLQEHLRDLYRDLGGGQPPPVMHVEDLTV